MLAARTVHFGGSFNQTNAGEFVRSFKGKFLVLRTHRQWQTALANAFQDDFPAVDLPQLAPFEVRDSMCYSGLPSESGKSSGLGSA